MVELKRNHSSDKTVGQVLRYMGWVREHLAGPDEAVEGLIVAHQADASVRYALSSVHGVRVKLYEVDFRFRDPSGPSKR